VPPLASALTLPHSSCRLQKYAKCGILQTMKQQLTELGDFIRQQRQRSAMSLRKLADAAGISNPYLSQIERGLRKPSAEILKSLARALSIRAEALYERAGLLEGVGEIATVREAIESDTTLTPGQKQALMQIYVSFVNDAHQEES
jgi:transcriptional regulator with XRE-family HTH domain